MAEGTQEGGFLSKLPFIGGLFRPKETSPVPQTPAPEGMTPEQIAKLQEGRRGNLPETSAQYAAKDTLTTGSPNVSGKSATPSAYGTGKSPVELGAEQKTLPPNPETDTTRSPL